MYQFIIRSFIKIVNKQNKIEQTKKVNKKTEIKMGNTQINSPISPSNNFNNQPQPITWSSQFTLLDKDPISHIYIMHHISSNQTYKIRHMVLNKSQNANVFRQIQARRNCSSPFLIKLEKVQTYTTKMYCSEVENVFLVYKYVESNLKQEILNRRFKGEKFTQEQVRLVIQAGLKSLFYLYQQDIPHPYLSPSQFLITPQRSILLCDPWLTPLSKSPQPLIQPYPSPQKILYLNDLISSYNKWYSQLFSLGVIVMEMIYLESMDELYQKGMRRIFYHHVKQKLEFISQEYVNQTTKQGVQDLKQDLRRLLAHEPRMRQAVYIKYKKYKSQYLFLQRPKQQFKQTIQSSLHPNKAHLPNLLESQFFKFDQTKILTKQASKKNLQFLFPPSITKRLVQQKSSEQQNKNYFNRGQNSYLQNPQKFVFGKVSGNRLRVVSQYRKVSNGKGEEQKVQRDNLASPVNFKFNKQLQNKLYANQSTLNRQNYLINHSNINQPRVTSNSRDINKSAKTVVRFVTPSQNWKPYIRSQSVSTLPVLINNTSRISSNNINYNMYKDISSPVQLLPTISDKSIINRLDNKPNATNYNISNQQQNHRQYTLPQYNIPQYSPLTFPQPITSYYSAISSLSQYPIQNISNLPSTYQLSSSDQKVCCLPSTSHLITTVPYQNRQLTNQTKQYQKIRLSAGKSRFASLDKYGSPLEVKQQSNGKPVEQKTTYVQQFIPEDNKTYTQQFLPQEKTTYVQQYNETNYQKLPVYKNFSQYKQVKSINYDQQSYNQNQQSFVIASMKDLNTINNGNNQNFITNLINNNQPNYTKIETRNQFQKKRSSHQEESAKNSFQIQAASKIDSYKPGDDELKSFSLDDQVKQIKKFGKPQLTSNRTSQQDSLFTTQNGSKYQQIRSYPSQVYQKRSSTPIPSSIAAKAQPILLQTPQRYPIKTRLNSTIREVSQQSLSHSINHSHNRDLSYITQAPPQHQQQRKVNLVGGNQNLEEIVYQDGSRYVGGLNQQRQRHGNGKLFYMDGQVAYQGGWSQDDFHGYGLLVNPYATSQITSDVFNYMDLTQIDQNLLRFQGNFNHDQKQGQGKFTLTNGQIYHGLFSQDLPHGRAKYYTNGGQIVDAKWQRGVLRQVIQITKV